MVTRGWAKARGKTGRGGGSCFGTTKENLGHLGKYSLVPARRKGGGGSVKEKKSLNLIQIIYIVQQFKKCTPVFQENHAHHVVQGCSICNYCRENPIKSLLAISSGERGSGIKLKKEDSKRMRKKMERTPVKVK